MRLGAEGLSLLVANSALTYAWQSPFCLTSARLNRRWRLSICGFPGSTLSPKCKQQLCLMRD